MAKSRDSYKLVRCSLRTFTRDVGVNKEQQRENIPLGQIWRGEQAFVSAVCNLVRVARQAEMTRTLRERVWHDRGDEGDGCG